MSDAEVVKSGVEVFEESKANAEMDQKDEPEGMAMQQEQVKSATIRPENYYKGSIWRKFLDRIGISDLNSRIGNPEVNYKEQVLDRQDTLEEHRLLVAVKEVARQHAYLGRASEISRSHKVKSATIWPESCNLGSLLRRVKSATIWPGSYYLRLLIRKCCLLCRRDMLVLTVVLAVTFLPSAEAFRRFETVQDAADLLAVLPYVDMDDLRNRLQEEAPTAGFSFGLWYLLIAFGACLVGGLASGFLDPGREPALPVEGQPQLAVREVNIDSTAAVVMLVVTLVTVVVVVVRCLGGR